MARLTGDYVLIYGGFEMDYSTLSDGVIIDVAKKTVIKSLLQIEMPLYSLYSGQVTPQGQLVALGVADANTVSQVFKFDE